MIDTQPRKLKMNLNISTKTVWNIFVVFYCCLGCDAAYTQKVRLVDLTHTFDENTIYWVTAKRLNFTVVYNGTGTASGQEYWYQLDEISAATHGGTHLDSPCHFSKGGWDVKDIPLQHLVVSTAIVDISKEVGDDPNVHLTVNHLKQWEKLHGHIPDKCLLLVRTGWSKFWPNPLTFSGTTERNASELKFPSITIEAAKWLVENRVIVGIGIDVMSIDVPGSSTVHVTLLSKNIYALENLNLVEELPPTGVKTYVMPMKLKSASGAPCRVIAEVPDGTTNDPSQMSNFSIAAIIAIAILIPTVIFSLCNTFRN